MENHLSGLQSYANLSGESGVRAFKVGSSFIRVRFTDGSAYLYTDAVTGQGSVERMKEFAIAGRGLNSYITRVIGKRYASKER
jgi:hypothetical protein